MNIYLNGVAETLSDSATSVADAIEHYFAHHSALPMFAVALNQEFVGQADYQTTEIKNGDSIELFSPIQGG